MSEGARSDFTVVEGPQGCRAISQYMDWDFTCLDILLDGAEWRAEQGLVPGAVARWSDFQARLHRHLKVEDQVLRPALYELGIPSSGARHSLVLEIHRAAANVGKHLASREWELFSPAVADLRELLFEHHRQQREHWKALDELLSVGKRGRMLERIRSTSAPPAPVSGANSTSCI